MNTHPTIRVRITHEGDPSLELCRPGTHEGVLKLMVYDGRLYGCVTAWHPLLKHRNKSACFMDFEARQALEDLLGPLDMRRPLEQAA